MKLINKLYLRVIISVVIGGILATGFTKFQQPCTTAPLGEDVTRCVEFSNLTINPGKIFSDSEVREEYIKNSAIVSLFIFVVLSFLYRRGK